MWLGLLLGLGGRHGSAVRRSRTSQNAPEILLFLEGQHGCRGITTEKADPRCIVHDQNSPSCCIHKTFPGSISFLPPMESGRGRSGISPKGKPTPRAGTKISLQTPGWGSYDSGWCGPPSFRVVTRARALTCVRRRARWRIFLRRGPGGTTPWPVPPSSWKVSHFRAGTFTPRCLGPFPVWFRRPGQGGLGCREPACRRGCGRPWGNHSPGRG